jgi:hypothetical protein
MFERSGRVPPYWDMSLNGKKLANAATAALNLAASVQIRTANFVAISSLSLVSTRVDL